MSGPELDPGRITSPFQLMAAWFAMLILLVSTLLTAAAHISDPSWAADFLLILSAVVIGVVLTFVGVMLTVFRPHLQDGKEYSEWLKDKNTYSTAPLNKNEMPINKTSHVPENIPEDFAAVAE